ncbi:MAG: hypothetical protein ACLQJL_16125 [Roseiarcus sp.]
MNRGGMACAAVALGVSAALAQSPIPVGNFAVTVKKDPFGDASTAIATTGDAYHAIGLRCLENQLSAVVVPDAGALTPGERYPVKFRADDKPIVETEGYALTEGFLEIDDGEAFLGAVAGARSLALRVVGPNSVVTFTLPLAQSDRVVAIVRKACGK